MRLHNYPQLLPYVLPPPPHPGHEHNTAHTTVRALCGLTHSKHDVITYTRVSVASRRLSMRNDASDEGQQVRVSRVLLQRSGRLRCLHRRAGALPYHCANAGETISAEGTVPLPITRQL